MNDYYLINEYIKKISQIQVKACSEIRDILVNKLNDYKNISVSEVIRGNYDKNDYRNYVWIIVRINNKEYWLTTFLNDLDELSGNHHTQIGKIQFYKDLSRPKIENKYCFTPNSLLENGKWVINPEKLYNPHINIYDDDYNPIKVVELFIEFLKENEELI